MDAKKLAELEILRAVYDEHSYPSIEASERPDFIVNDKEVRFGVEITRYYQLGETGGRIANDKSYLDRVVKDGTVHPKDKGVVSVVNIGINTGGKTIMLSSNFMYRPILSMQERLKKLGELIDEKNGLYKNYDESLDYIDLLIYDHGDLWAGTEGRALITHLESLQQKRSERLQTPFRNIFLYTRKIGDRKVIHLWQAE